MTREKKKEKRRKAGGGGGGGGGAGQEVTIESVWDHIYIYVGV